jgi:hypothetical protein
MALNLPCVVKASTLPLTPIGRIKEDNPSLSLHPSPQAEGCTPPMNRRLTDYHLGKQYHRYRAQCSVPVARGRLSYFHEGQDRSGW